MPPSTTPGSSVPRYSSLAAPTWPLPTRTEARLSQVTCDRLPAGEVLRGFLVRFCCGLSSRSPPVRIRPEISQPSGLLLPGFRRVGHPGAGYNYDSHWIALSMGLSPIGLTSSLAARLRNLMKVAAGR